MSTQDSPGRARFAAALAELGPEQRAELGRIMARMLAQASAARAPNLASTPLTDAQAAGVRAGLRVRSTPRGGPGR